MPKKIADLIAELPDADRPGKESKFTGPQREAAWKVASAIVDGGRQSLLELVGMIRDGTGDGEANYKPGYALHCVALWVSADGREKQRRVFVDTVASQLGGDSPAKEVQAYLVRELQAVGGPEVAATLGRLLGDAELVDDAAAALVAIGDGAAGQLRAALPSAEGRCRLAIVQALGSVCDADSIAPLVAATKDADADVRLAAVRSLALIGSADAVGAVAKATDAAGGWEKIQATKSCLVLVEKLVAAGKKKAAAPIAELLGKSDDAYVRDAATRAMTGA